MVFTFTLRTDTAFQSGRPLTAQDVKYSWERAADPDTDSQTASTYLGDIVGVQAKLDGEAEEIAGIRVIDDHTLVVRLDGPKPINTSGGLKCKGHPVGATGVSQLYEVWTQLRGKAGKRQVPMTDLRIGGAHNLGGTGGTYTFTILERR